MKYYKALMQMGHMGTGKHLPVNIYVKANDLLSAMKKAKAIPAIKHGKLPLEMKEISYQEYLDGLQKGEYYARIARDSVPMEGEDERNYNLY